MSNYLDRQLNVITRIVLIATKIAVIAGCASSTNSMVEKAGLQESIVSSNWYRHVLFHPVQRSGGDRLHVYIGGDGIPWINGRKPSADPTPRNALTIRLMTRDGTDAVFVGRPCYFGFAGDANCSALDWTSGRYSEKITKSMTSVIVEYAAKHRYEEIILIGYSGGGVLGRLIATEVPGVIGLLTIAANLDIAEWTRVRGFRPLTSSLNPAKASPLAPRILHVQAIGELDTIVPRSVTGKYIASGNSPIVWVYPEFDHVRRWDAEWANILGRFESLLSSSREPGW